MMTQKIPPHKRTNSAEHHYFPKALQKFWRNTDGYVSRLNGSGNLKKSKNGTFGHIRNAHRIRILDKPSVWDESFEHIFGSADGKFGRLIDCLQDVLTSPIVESDAFNERLFPTWKFEEDQRSIGECLASLVVRSPGLRNVIRVGVQPFHDGPVPDHLISANQKHLLTVFGNSMANRGKFLFLIAKEGEFVFGDGMLNNFRPGGPPSPHNPRCLVPLTPDIAIAYDCPSRYAMPGRFMCMALSKSEVDQVNYYTMVYSKDFIFFRDFPPNDLGELECGAFHQFEYHNPDWLVEVFDALAKIRFQKPSTG